MQEMNSFLREDDFFFQTVKINNVLVLFDNHQYLRFISFRGF